MRHWTERNVKDYLYSIGAEFIRQIESYMDAHPKKTRNQIAKAMKVSPGRVSQLFNNPGNVTLRNLVKCARVLGLKVAIVAYGDNDPSNQNGPIPAEIFRACWEKAGQPRDFASLQPATFTATSATYMNPSSVAWIGNGKWFILTDEERLRLEIKKQGEALTDKTVRAPIGGYDGRTNPVLIQA